MLSILFSEGGTVRPGANHLLPGRRAASRLPRLVAAAGYQELALAEIVRDLVGWTPPAPLPAARPQPAGWCLA